MEGVMGGVVVDEDEKCVEVVCTSWKMVDT